MIRVLGLDLSLTATGVAHPDGSTSTLHCAAHGMARLAELQNDVWERAALPFTIRDVDLVVIEGYAMGTGRQSHSYAIGELGGVIRLQFYEECVPYVDVPPACLKKYATGKGNASKDDVFAEAIRRLGYAGRSKDEADALWLRAMALDHYGQPEVVMPMAHRGGLGNLDWPNLHKGDGA